MPKNIQRNKAKESRCNERKEAKARKNWETQTKLGTASHAGLASLALARFAFAADQQKRAAAGRKNTRQQQSSACTMGHGNPEEAPESFARPQQQESSAKPSKTQPRSAKLSKMPITT